MSTRWVFFTLAVLFYFYEFLMRVFPSVMVQSLMVEFHMTAETFGLLSGIYFLFFAPLQLPVGLLMDRFGARRLLIFATLICGVGGILFGRAHSLFTLGAARSFIGIGSAFAFVGVVYLVSHLFPRKRLSLLIGIANSVAIMGGVMGEGPVSFFEEYFGWRMSAVLLGVGGIVLSGAFLLAVLTEPKGLDKKMIRAGSFQRAWKQFKRVMSCRLSWLNALTALFIYGTTGAFSALWGVPFLEKSHGLTRTEAGFVNSMIYIGWVAGGPLIGSLSDWIGRRHQLLFLSSLGAFLALLPVIYLTGLPTTLLVCLLLLVGFFSAAQVLCFSYAVQLHPQEASGSSIALTNFTVTIGGALLQPLVGILLDFFWSGGLKEGVRVYSLIDYKWTMTLFPLCFLLAALFSLFLKETKTPIAT